VLPVFDPREHLPLRGRIAFQPIGDVHSMDVPTAFEQLTKELLGGGFSRRRCTGISRISPS
jgi:hypothetical protein